MGRGIFLFKKALQNLRADFWLNLITALVIALSLTLVGAFGIAATNASGLVDQFAGDVEVMIYLAENHSLEQVENLMAQLQSDPKVATVSYIEKAMARERFKSQVADMSALIDALEENPLPASIEIKLKSQYSELPDLENFAAHYIKNPGVEEVYYGKEWVDRLGRIVRLLWISGALIGVFLAGTAVFIISTTLRLAIHRRKDEIQIMRLVGATNRFIQAPFVVEGILQGLTGAALSIGALYGFFRYATFRLSVNADLLLPFFPKFSFDFLPAEALAGLALMGVLVGLFGSLLSIGKFLKV